MYMIEITEDKVSKMSEYAEKMLRYGGKLMQCLDELEGGEYGEREHEGRSYPHHEGSYSSRYGMRSRYDNYGDRYMGYRDDDDDMEDEMRERRRRSHRTGRYM